MDQAFLLRAQRLLDQRPSVHPDYAELAALTVARQGLTPTAQAHGRCTTHLKSESSPTALAALLLGEEGWSEAAAGQSCFSRAMAIRRINPG
jgi:hypothetical protein